MLVIFPFYFQSGTPHSIFFYIFSDLNLFVVHPPFSFLMRDFPLSFLLYFSGINFSPLALIIRKTVKSFLHYDAFHPPCQQLQLNRNNLWFLVARDSNETCWKLQQKPLCFLCNSGNRGLQFIQQKAYSYSSI